MYWKKSPQPGQKEKPLPKLIEQASKLYLSTLSFITVMLFHSLQRAVQKKIQLK